MASRRHRTKDPAKWANTLDFKPSNIRIWIHNRDIGKLQHVLWEGHGSKLRCETSNNVRVKRFLEAVPFIMATIKDIHTATIKNDIDTFRRKVEEPVSPIILSSKDSNGLNVLHKAAGLGYVDLAREILERYPVIVNASDNDGKTPLHYAAVCRDGGVMYDLLVEYGGDESKVDHRQKTAAFYKNRPADVDLSSLVMIPDAPRVSGNSYPRHWDWRIIDPDQPLPRMKRTSNNTDDDSAFGSAESAKLTEDVVTPEIENADDELNGDEAADEENNGVEDEEKPDEEQEENPETEENENPEADEEAQEENPEAEDNEKAEENEETENPEEGQEEEDAPVTEVADKETGEIENAPDKQDPEADEPEKEEDEENEEKAEPSIADSGVVDTPNDEEQVIIGEHTEPPDKENDEAAAAADEAEEDQEQEEEDKDGDADGMAVDEETAELLENGNMEQLAALVLTGEGHRLIGRNSSNPELQAFIDNVPAYMAKIRAVHKAAREGNLKDLQISLDRRKFAIAKDASSPHGATPLHVAVIFGHTPVIRYLAGRFPETAHALDLDGRTPLHYAATLADNGHYYNLLLHLGANPLVQDNFGHKADFYKENQDDLSHKQLLRDFGASESLADEMLVDKDLTIFQDEEGRYLASSLGDPLIKGLTEVATTRPKDPVTYLATYLYNFANQDKSKDNNEDTNMLIIPEGEQNEQDVNDEDNQDNDNDDGYPQSPDLDTPESLFAETERDENGQSSLHFAANRSHSKDGLYHLLQERQFNIAFRDSGYRTGRDIAKISGNNENVREIDRFVVYLAARGETDKLVELLMEGYDHILDTEDEGKNVLQIAEEEDNKSTVEFLKSIQNYTELRDEIHRAIRSGNTLKVRELMEMNGEGARLLALGKNRTGRCSLHIAVLREHEDIVRYIAKTYPETLQIGDNLERTALHYAMGVPSVENLSSILIKAGAKRVQKDLRSRQPSYYYMNKSDIKQLQDEEESMEK